jgi:hypothetical protein
MTDHTPTGEKKELLAEATRLYEEQRESRGWDEITGDQRQRIVSLLGLPKGQKVMRLRPYHSSPEGDRRASRIVALRKQAARLS